MSKSVQLIKDHDVKWIDLRFTDTKGIQHHVTMPSRDALDEDFFEVGKMFDGSSIAGWKGIEASDMILLPDDDTAVLDPFTEDATLILVCDIIEPSTMQGYDRDPRAIAHRAADLLAPGGLFAMEHHEAQGPALLAALGADPRFTGVRVHPDLTGRDRFLTARRSCEAAAGAEVEE